MHTDLACWPTVRAQYWRMLPDLGTQYSMGIEAGKDMSQHRGHPELHTCDAAPPANHEAQPAVTAVKRAGPSQGVGPPPQPLRDHCANTRQLVFWRQSWVHGTVVYIDAYPITTIAHNPRQTLARLQGTDGAGQSPSLRRRTVRTLQGTGHRARTTCPCGKWLHDLEPMHFTSGLLRGLGFPFTRS